MIRLFLSLAILVIPARAFATDCSTLANPIYLQVGDTELNLVKQLGRALRDNSAKPITLVYLSSGSCTNISAITSNTPITATLSYSPSISEDSTWMPTDTPLTCTPPSGGVVPDITDSSLFISACTANSLPATVANTRGPVSDYVFVVPQVSLQTAITYEEAYFVFGFGAAGMITPWNDESKMFITTSTKSLLIAWANTLSIPALKWKGMPLAAQTDIASMVGSSTTPEITIGMLNGNVYDDNRDTLNVLAFRSKGQYAAYYPDSTSMTRDKQNVRDGHYTVWSPTTWMNTLSGGQPVKPDAQYVVDMLANKAVSPAPNFDPIEVIVDSGLIPDCAMKVTRFSQGGDLSLYQPAASCACKYESLVGTSSCTGCSGSCATGVCRDGFCEAQ